MSLEVRTVTVCLFMHMRMCERDEWTQRKKDCLSTVASDVIRRTHMWRERERERERKRERERERMRDRVKVRGRACERVGKLSLIIASGLACVN